MLEDDADLPANNTRAVRFCLMTLFLCLSLGLGVNCHRRTDTARKQTQNATTAPQQSTVNISSELDKGDLKLRYQQRKKIKRGTAVRKVVSDPQALEQVVDILNDRIALPWDIVLSFADCEEPDAYYDPETRQIRICYQLIDEYYDLFGPKINDQNTLDEEVRGAVAATFFHELGHALVDAWQIPITGKEEDAVDQLSTLVLIRNTERGERMALAGALSFKLYADLDKGQAKIYWDEHSLDQQRFYDTICLIYGHAPEKYAYLVQDGTLPVERAEICREDYPKVARSWHQLLSPYLKHPDQARAADSAK